MCRQPLTIQFELPEWISAFIGENNTLNSIEERMSLVIKASRLNVMEGTGGPFAAAIFEQDSGKLISLGVNLVETANLSILHAEMVAFAVAQTKLGTYDLGAQGMPAHELVTSTEPCAMCFGAISWSGVRRVIIGARDSDARLIGFDEGPKLDDWPSALEQRGIEVIRDIQREQAAIVLTEYLSHGGNIYNART